MERGKTITPANIVLGLGLLLSLGLNVYAMRSVDELWRVMPKDPEDSLRSMQSEIKEIREHVQDLEGNDSASASDVDGLAQSVDKRFKALCTLTNYSVCP